ncbi:MAG: hypothetical protein ACRDTS_07515 [Mycobacterium sp.]
MSPIVAHHRARVGALQRCVKTGERKADDPEYLAAKRDLAAANIEVYIERQLAKAPPLTDQQRTELADLLQPAREHIRNERMRKADKRSGDDAT